MRIVSLNGLDGSGKTTLLNELQKDERIFGIDASTINPNLCNKLLSHKWWFHDSNPEEFCDILYGLISNQQIAATKLNENVILLDKGLSNFEARIWATLLIKGVTETTAKKMMCDYKKKYNIQDIEEVRLLLTGDEIRKTRKINNNDYTKMEQQLYEKYSNYQAAYLNKYERRGYYSVKIPTCTSVEVTKDIILNYLFGNISAMVNDHVLYGNRLNIIIDVFCKARTAFEDLLLFFVHGSTAWGTAIENHSDIDVILVVKSYEQEKFYEFCSDFALYSIKVGVTIYAKQEVETLSVDAKTLYSLYHLQRKNIKAIFSHRDFCCPKITISTLCKKNKAVIPETIHKLKRILVSNPVNQKEVVKNLNLIMKVFLINEKRVFPKSYKDVFYQFSKNFGVKEFDINGVIFNNQTVGLIEYANEIVNLISNGGLK